MYDIIIVGAGAAGLTAAIYANRAGHSVCVFESSMPGGQAIETQTIENWPGTKQVSGADFAVNLYEQAQKLEIPIKFLAVTAIKQSGNYKAVQTPQGEFTAKAIILANGLRRRTLGLKNEERLKGHGVSYCAICDGNFFKGKAVAVVGGGDAALEDALYLSKLCSEVFLIHRRGQIRAKKYLIDKALAAANIKPLMECTVTDILGENSVQQLIISGIKGEQRLIVSGVFIAIGFVPNNAPFSPPVKLDDNGFIAATEACETNISGIYAAGDCRAKEFRQLVTAASDGAVAASKAGQYILSE